MKSETKSSIVKFLEKERNEAEAAVKKEKISVCIKADSYIAKEIKYQTALMHQILDELRQLQKM